MAARPSRAEGRAPASPRRGPLAVALASVCLALACLALAACGSGGSGRGGSGAPAEGGAGALERSLGLEPRAAQPADPAEPSSRAGAGRGQDPPAEEEAEARDPDWPLVPTLRVRLLDREGRTESLELGPPAAWVDEERWRWAEERVPLAGLVLFVWREQWERADATRVTVALVNGIPDRGVAYFQELAIELGEKVVLELEGRHCVLPRGILARRFFAGPDAARLVTWSMVRDRLPGWTPSWAGARCAEQLAHLRRQTDGSNTLGPYRVGDPLVSGSSSLAGSHGGWKIAPYGGGAQSWYAGAIEGWQLSEEQFFRTLARSPIAILDAQTFEAFNPRVDYWLGRTVPHELPGFRAEPDEWCPYGKQLFRFRPHDHTHLWRQIRDAAQLARFDAAARWFLLASWHDCTLWLDSGGARSSNSLFWPLEKQLSTTPPGTGAGWAGRGFAHVVRCFLEAEPYLPDEEARLWRERLAAALRHVVIPGTGVAHAHPRRDDVAPTLDPPVARAREVDLLGSCFRPMGLTQEDADWRRFMRPVAGDSVAGSFEIRPGMRSWADGRGSGPNYFPEYDAFRGDLGPYGGTVEGLLRSARSRPVNENPLDWTDPAVWRPPAAGRR